MCGGDIPAQEGAAFGTCDSCGGTSTLPKANEERIVNLFNRANHFRRLGEFDKALATYEGILNEDSTNAEAHWGVALCRYGIEYVKDPKTHELVPTCHRAQFEAILTDADYLAALENSPDSYTKGLYEAEAKKISEIQKGILAISSREEPFDVFICYKESTDGGSRTKDSALAQDIYYQLTNEGFRVFFARITLEDKLGQQYEPYIFNALNSAKVMLVVGTKKEHLEAVWVKNEWSRFLALMKKDRSRLLIPCYRDMDAYDLPDEMANLQAHDMSKIGFVQDLVRGIKKVLDASNTPEVKQDAPEYIPTVIPKKYSQQTVDNDKRELAKAIAEIESYRRELEMQLEDARHELQMQRENERDESRRLQQALRDARERARWDDNIYNNAALLAAQSTYNPYTDLVGAAQQKVDSIKNLIAEANRKIPELKAQEDKFINEWVGISPVQRMENAYQSFLDRKNTSSDEKDFIELAKEFREMEGYKDSEALADECEKLGVKAKYDNLVTAMRRASKEEEFRELAKQFRAISGYKDTAELSNNCEKQYHTLKEQREEQERNERKRREEQERIDQERREQERKEEFDSLLQLKSKAKTKEEYQELANKFREMGKYENSAELANECDMQINVLEKKEEANRKSKRTIKFLLTVLSPIVGMTACAMSYSAAINSPTRGSIVSPMPSFFLGLIIGGVIFFIAKIFND